MKALAFLSKYLGIHDEFRGLIKAYGLKWSSGNSDDVIIARLTKPNNSHEIVDWIKALKQKIPAVWVFTDFIMATGLRFEESVNAYNLIIDLAAQGKLHEYYDAEKEVLEHYRYKEFFIRRSKKVFISFVSKDMVERIAACQKLTMYTIENQVKRAGFKSRWSDIREYYSSLMTKYLSQPEIDFIQGRISTSVFMKNYFNPAWIGDLKNRALEGAHELLKVFS